MSNLKAQITQDIKDAMKSGDSFKRDTLRMLSSAIKQVEVDERKTLDDNDIIQILKKACKQREEAASQYKQANRMDLFEKETQEMNIILAYLPKQLNDDELLAALKPIIAELSATNIKDLGKVMPVAIQKLGSVADGKRISTLLKKLLQ